ncbi:cytochrome c oxidase subunit II [Natronococcus jeotgali]|uniref:cytochrome c oxidase subunit II n=1 Tax=Natronococcus jeotgali TaxID=413812 RepID=UPI000677AF78|nr:cytochrome c oxidase subunit II [Natronococcus jeotgali]
MGRARRGAIVAAVLIPAVLATVPATALASSATDQLISRLNRQLLYIAVPIAVLVEAILIYTIWRFRDNDDPKPTRENRQLEITWTVATALVLLFVGTASFHVLADPAVSTISDSPHGEPEPGEVPEDAVEVNVTAEQWAFTADYPNEGVTTNETMVLPANRTVYMYVTSEDVIHSVHVPDLGLKQDAVPGETNLVRTELSETGEYRLYCAELCGAGHPEMLSSIRVVDESEYDAWLDDQRSGSDGSTSNESTASNES